jgi:uncharacterized protein YjbI with pentapeptide repeats
VLYKTILLAAVSLIGITGITSVFASDITSITSSTFTSLANPVILMNDTTASTGWAVNSGRPINTEFVSPASQLIGKQMDTMIIKLKKTGLPTGTAQVGIFNTDLSVKKLFGTKDVATLTGTYTDYSFNLSSELYTIQSGDRIGVKFTGGNATVNIAIMRDTNATDPFDGINSYHTYYDTAWRNATANDLYMVLEQVQPSTGGTVGLADLKPNSVDSSKIVDGSIVNADISPVAAILLTKLAVGLLPAGITINSANIVDGSITGADIAPNTITGAKIAANTITGAKIAANTITGDKMSVGIQFIDCTKLIPSANLAGCDLHGMDLHGKDLNHANLSGANLNHANLQNVTLSSTNLSGADLDNADIGYAILDHANLVGANLGSVSLFHSQLQYANLNGANLNSAYIVGANLYGANLSGAILDHVNLSGADLTIANLSATSAPGVNLSGANLGSTSFVGADLSSANLSGANLSYTNLSGATLYAANLDSVTINGANLSGIDLRFAINQPTGNQGCLYTPIHASFTCTG